MARNMIRIGEPKQVSVNKEQDKTRFVYSMSDAFQISNSSQRRVLQYDLPSDAVIEFIGITIKEFQISSGVSPRLTLRIPDADTQAELRIKNLDRVIVSGYAGAIDEIFGEGFTTYTQLTMNGGAGDVVPFYMTTKEGFIGRKLSTPLHLKKSDILYFELSVPGIATPVGWGYGMVVNILFGGYWVKNGSITKRKVGYYRVQHISEVNQSVIIDIPTMSKINNMAFMLCNSDGELLKQGFRDSGSINQPNFAGHIGYLTQTIVNFTYNRGNSAVDLVTASGINDYAYSRYIFPIEQNIEANYEMMTARVQPASGYTNYIEQIGGMYVYFEYEPITTEVP